MFLAFANIHFSTNGGVTFGAASPHAEIHPDHRAIVFSPLSHIDNGQTNPSQTDVFVGNDGGIYSGSSRRLSYWQSLNATIATTLIMQIDMGNNDLGKPVYAGLWDHGATSNYVTDSFIMRRYPLAWIKYVNGDGGSAVADPDDPTSSYQVGNFGLVWTTDGGRTVTPLPAGIADNPNNIGIAGTRSHPGSEGSTVTTAGHLYTAYGRRLMQDTERLFEFPIKVSDIQASRPPRLWVTLWEDRNPMGGSVLSRADARMAPFTNHGVLGDPGVNNAKFANVGVDAVDPNIVCVVYSGFTMRGPPASQHVFLTTNGGRDWADIVAACPICRFTMWSSIRTAARNGSSLPQMPACCAHKTLDRRHVGKCSQADFRLLRSHHWRSFQMPGARDFGPERGAAVFGNWSTLIKQTRA